MLEVVPYDAELLPDLAAAYNRAVEGVPHCYAVEAAELAAGLTGGQEGLRDPTVLVVRADGCVRGFADVGLGRSQGADETDHGIVRFFCYDRGYRQAGQVLVGAVERYCRGRGVSWIEVSPQEWRYPFYHLQYAYLSQHLDHLYALLRFNGYEAHRGELFLDWPDYVPVKPAPVEADVRIEWQEGRGARPGLVARAHRGNNEIGRCKSVCGGEFSRAQDAQDWACTLNLNVVSEVLRGQGIGRHLLQRSLFEMHAVGYRHAVISTAWDNFRAFLFYSNCGYRAADWTYGLRRVPEGELGRAASCESAGVVSKRAPRDARMVPMKRPEEVRRRSVIERRRVVCG